MDVSQAGRHRPTLNQMIHSIAVSVLFRAYVRSPDNVGDNVFVLILLKYHDHGGYGDGGNSNGDGQYLVHYERPGGESCFS